MQRVLHWLLAGGGSVRAREIKRKFDEIINGFNSYTAEEACVECYKYADAAGWLKDTKVQDSAKKNEQRSYREDKIKTDGYTFAQNSDKVDSGKAHSPEAELGAPNVASPDFNSIENESTAAEKEQYLKDMSARLDELLAQIRLDKKPTTADYDKERRVEQEVADYLKSIGAKLENLCAQVRANKKPTTPDYELNSRVEYLMGMFDRGMRDRWNSFEEAKLHADKVYKACLDHALGMGWIISDEEKHVEQEVESYLKEISAKLESLYAQVRANKKPTTPDYELNSRVEYLKGMFDREMRSPLRDRWNSFDEAKQHADKAYKACLDHALGMGWIDGMSYIK